MDLNKPIETFLKSGADAFKSVHPVFYLVYVLLLAGLLVSWSVIYIINDKHIELMDKYDTLHESKVTLALSTTEALANSVNSITKVSGEVNSAVATNAGNIAVLKEEITHIKNSLHVITQNLEKLNGVVPK